MDENEDSGSLSWGASLFVQTTEDGTRTMSDTASSAPVHSPRPSVVFSSREDYSGSPLQKLQSHVAWMLKGFSPSPDVPKGSYNPEVLTSQKRQWAKSLDHRPVKEASRLFESMVIIGLHPNTDVHTLQMHILDRRSEDSKRFRSFLNNNHQIHAEPNIEPQVLFVYPPAKRLPLKYRDLTSFCFPGGPEVHAIERTPSMSELNEMLLGQEQRNQSDLSFVFRLQGADDSTLYGCCILIEELLQKPSGLISMLVEEQPFSSLSRHILTTPRCYCILSRLPFFDLHFSILRSIFNEERLIRLTKGMDMLNTLATELIKDQECIRHESECAVQNLSFSEVKLDKVKCAEVNLEASSQGTSDSTGFCYEGHSERICPVDETNTCSNLEGICEDQQPPAEEINISATNNDHAKTVNGFAGITKHEKHLPEAVLPLLHYYHHETSDSSASFQVSVCERSGRSDLDEDELEELSSSGQENCSDHSLILEWSKENGHGPLQIICEYYKLSCPSRGSTLTFQPLEHLNPFEFQRPGETALHIAGSTIDLMSCSTSLEVAEVHNALLAEEEATALSIWTVACICGNLRLENVLTMFAGALLEKQILIVCSNLGVLSASVLSIIPLIRPYHWQSLLMPVLPNDMLDFLDAPVPYIVGIKNKTSDVQSRLANVILIDVNRNQVKSPSMPQLPQHKELFSSLSSYHATLVGESYLARKRPVYECTDVQVEAAKGFLVVLRSYLDSLCSNLRSHTITNVQSNDDKVSLLLKESFIDSFPYRDRAFMKHFVDTQLFSVHTDLVLSFYQKD